MKKVAEIDVKGMPVRVMGAGEEDYICPTDMLKAKDGDFFVTDWLRNRNTLEYVGIREKVYKPHFNYGEFAAISSRAGLNLICLSNAENLNAVMIQDGIVQPERLKRLNEIAIHQMRVLASRGGRNLFQ